MAEMQYFSHKLSNKILGILIGFFVVAILAISMTLLISWQLEGGAAAINDAGSQRMRSYRIGHLLARGVSDDKRLAELMPQIQSDVEQFEKVLLDLEKGDPLRPLSPPRDAYVFNGVMSVKKEWSEAVKPIVLAYLYSETPTSRAAAATRYDEEVVRFVSEINDLVLHMERNYAYNTTLLRTCQIGLAVLAVIGTLLLIRFFFVLVIRPVDYLHEGIQRMSENDLSVRLPVESKDEFGHLAQGFNQMAGHLAQVYATLEQRVADKTRTLAEKNQELAMLYEITSFLNEPGSIEALCQGFIARIKQALKGRAGAVRLYSEGSAELFMMTHEGLSEAFVESEMTLRCGECLCGEVVQNGMSVAFDVQKPPAGYKLQSCAREGFRTATAFTISHNKETIGVFNIYFDQHREFSEPEVRLLETLGTHLGVAIENQRLKSSEKELAVFEERNLLAQELHDSIAQGLAFLNIQAQLLQDSLKKEQIAEAMETTGKIREGIQESYEDVRELLVHFRTRLHQTDLDTAILKALERLEEQTGISTQFDRVGSGAPLRSEDDIQIIHIVQESLSNIRKHARASAVRVTVERSVNGMTIAVFDDGSGFDAATNPALVSDRHVGMKIMKERAARAGGQCVVTSVVGKGTSVVLTLPRVQKEAA